MTIYNLPEFNEAYNEYYDPVRKSFEIRRRSRTEGNLASISEASEYIDAFLRKYQATFIPNALDKSILFFPFMFIEPSPGDIIRNLTTNEAYTISRIIKNPETNRWEGLVKLNMASAPSLEGLHALEIVNRSKLVRFSHEVPDLLVNQVGANLEGSLKEPPPIQPTITWSIKTMEPGTLGSMTSSKREWKSRLRESYKDPLVQGHTVEVWGQKFSNTVQFDCWSNDPRTSDRLVSWFEQFMRLYTGNLRRSGLGNIIFLKRDQDSVNQVWRQAYNIRGSQYLIETEQLEAHYSRDILKIDISIETNTEHSPFGRRDTHWVADQMVSGELSYQEYRDLFYRSGEYLFGSIDILQ